MIKELKEKILALQEECGRLYRQCRDTGNFDSDKHDKLCKQIEWHEYLLWGEVKS